MNDDEFNVVAQAWWRLMNVNEPEPRRPTIMRRGEQLVYAVSLASGAPRLAAYGIPELRLLLIREVQFIRSSSRGDAFVGPKREVLEMLLRGHLLIDPDNLAPSVSRIISAPVFDRHGELVATPGYHADSGLYYSPDSELEAMNWSQFTAPDPSGERLAWALDLLDDLVTDFPFAEPADRANALALLLLPFVRELISGPTPIHVILAPAAGSGKTLLAQVLLYPACGPTAIYAEPRTDEEWRKAITTYLLTNPTALVFDNVSRLDSAALAAAVTSPTSTWTDRVLGASEQASMQVRCAWVVTGNNVTLTTEQARRSVPIKLDSELENPWQRTSFRHPNLLTYARESRALLVGAALTIISHWLRAEEHAGFQREGSLVLGSFENWARRLGGLLADAGEVAFMTNHAAFAQAEDADDEGLSEFLASWAELGLQPLAKRELESLVAPLGALHQVAPEELRAARDGERGKALQYWLRAHRGRVCGGHRLALVDGRPRRWSAVRL